MKTITVAALQHLLTSGSWMHTTEYHTADKGERPIEDMDDDNELVIRNATHEWGYAVVKSVCGAIEIEYAELWSWDVNMPDTLCCDKKSPSFELCGATLVDDDGDALQFCNEADSFEIPAAFTAVAYAWAVKDIETLDIVESDTVETYTIEQDNAPSIRFSGELIASVKSSDNNAMGSWYSGSSGRWTELELYKTSGGKFVCAQVGRTRWQGERDRYSAAVCNTEAEVIEFFGQRWLAKELYERANIQNVVVVE